jgi:hypothetical protein
MDVVFDLGVDEMNQRWEEPAAADVRSQMILKETDDIVQSCGSTVSGTTGGRMPTWVCWSPRGGYKRTARAADTP